MLMHQPSRWGRVAVLAPALTVAAAAVAATAHGGYEVAVACAVPPGIAWLYPLITDGLALVAYAATHQLRQARWYAWLVVVLAAALSGLAQAVYLASGPALDTSPVLRFGVGAWPAVAGAVAAHLVYLLARRVHPQTPAGAAVPSHAPAGPIAEPLSAAAAEALTAAIGVPVWPRSRLGLLPTAVYRLFDETDRLVYVGITCDLALRLADHKLCKPWWSVVVRVDVEMFSSRAEALAEERDAIATEVPLHNRLPGSRTDLGVAKAIADDAREGPVSSARHLIETGVVGPALEQEEPPADQVRRDEHYEAVQRLADDLGQRPTRQAVRDLTGVGATRADRLRNAVVVRTTDDLVRTGPEGPPA